MLDKLVRAKGELQEQLEAHVDHHEGHPEVDVGENVRRLHRLQVGDGQVGDVRKQSAENQSAPPVAGTSDGDPDGKDNQCLGEHHEVGDNDNCGDLVDEGVVDVRDDLLECQTRNEHPDRYRADVPGRVHCENVLPG